MSELTERLKGCHDYVLKNDPGLGVLEDDTVTIWLEAASEIEALSSKIEEQALVIRDLVEALDELVDLMDAVIDGDYTPDSFTNQPARAAIAKAKQP